MTFIARDQAPEVLQPGKEAFNLPAAAVSAELTAVLRLAAPTAIGRDQLDVALHRQPCVKAIRIVRLVAPAYVASINASVKSNPAARSCAIAWSTRANAPDGAQSWNRR